MNCKDCPNWNAKLLTCKLNPDVKRDKKTGCRNVFCPCCGSGRIMDAAFAPHLTVSDLYCENCGYEWDI